MKQIIKYILIVVLLLCSTVTSALGGNLRVQTGSVDGGSIAFYSDANCSTELGNTVEVGSDVYIKVSPYEGYACGLADSDGKVRFIKVEKVVDSDVVQSRTRGIALGELIDVYATQTEGVYLFRMPDDTNVNVQVSAKFSVLYTIKLDANGGTIDDSYPEVYTVDSEDITLPTPTRPGYDFDGWTGTGLGAATKTVTIVSGSTGHRSYTATWSKTFVTTSYIDAEGTLHENIQATPLTASFTTLEEGIYVVNSDITFTNGLKTTGDVTLILADGYNMNLGTEQKKLSVKGIESSYNLTVYGQVGCTGYLKIYSNSQYGIHILGNKAYTQHSGNVFIWLASGDCIVSGDVNLLGGTIDVQSGTGDGEIRAININIRGGKIWARNRGLNAINSLTLGLTNDTDLIYAEKYNCSKTSVVAGQALYYLYSDKKETVIGSVSNSELNYMARRELKKAMSWNEMKAELAANGTVTLQNSVIRDSEETLNITTAAVVDLNGYDLLGFKSNSTKYDGYSIFNVTDGGRLTITDGSAKKAGYLGKTHKAVAIVVNGSDANNYGSLTLSGGTIKNFDYDGVEVNGYGCFTMNGGTITICNTGVNINSATAAFNVSGNVNITGNKLQNVSMYCNGSVVNPIHIVGALASTSRIGLHTGFDASLLSPSQTLILTDGLKDRGAKENFVYGDESQLKLVTLESGELALSHPYTVTVGEGISISGCTAENDGTYIVGCSDVLTLNYQGDVPDGYSLAFCVKDNQNNEVSVSTVGDVHTFVMPAGNVSINVRWKKLLFNQSITISTPNDVTYNGSAHTPEITVKDGDTDITAQCDTTYSNHVNAGTATITITAKAESAYSGTITQTFTINQKALTITAEAKTKVYGTEDPALTYSVEGLVEGESLTGSLARAEGETVGEYDITQGTLAASANYSVTFTGAKFTITKKVLKITAEAKTKVEGEKDPDLTYSVEGLVEGESLTGALARAEGETVGEYDITQGTLAASANYSVTFTGAKFTITANPNKPNNNVVNTDKPTTQDGEEFYEPNADTQQLLSQSSNVSLGFSAGASQNVNVGENGVMTFTQGQDADIMVNNQKTGDVLKMEFQGTIKTSSDHLQAVGSQTRTRGTRGGQDLELVSGAEYRVVHDGNIVLTVVLTEAPATITGINVSSSGSTGISSVEGVQPAEGVYYDLNGHKFYSKPTKKGVYIHQGTKVVVK